MFTIRCTRRLLSRLGPPVDEDRVTEPTTILGDWYANVLNVGRKRLILCTSERTLLSVLVPARDLSGFPERLRQAVGRSLAGLGVSAPMVDRELREMRWHQYARTANRRVLGSMNDFALATRWYLEDEPDADLDELGRRLSRAPCSPIEAVFPDRFTQTLFEPATG